MLSLLSEAICYIFEKECGKWQIKKTPPQVYQVRFTLAVDGDKEDGYRNLTVLFWAPMNYVGVWWREEWNTIPIEDLHFDGEDCAPLPGKSYVSGTTPWERAAYHDSCWRDGVARVLRQYERGILCFAGRSWKCIPLSEAPKDFQDKVTE